MTESRTTGLARLRRAAPPSAAAAGRRQPRHGGGGAHPLSSSSKACVAASGRCHDSATASSPCCTRASRMGARHDGQGERVLQTDLTASLDRRGGRPELLRSSAVSAAPWAERSTRRIQEAGMVACFRGKPMHTTSCVRSGTARRREPRRSSSERRERPLYGSTNDDAHETCSPSRSSRLPPSSTKVQTDVARLRPSRGHLGHNAAGLVPHCRSTRQIHHSVVVDVVGFKPSGPRQQDSSSAAPRSRCRSQWVSDHPSRCSRRHDEGRTRRRWRSFPASTTISPPAKPRGPSSSSRRASTSRCGRWRRGCAEASRRTLGRRPRVSVAGRPTPLTCWSRRASLPVPSRCTAAMQFRGATGVRFARTPTSSGTDSARCGTEQGIEEQQQLIEDLVRSRNILRGRHNQLRKHTPNRRQ